MQLQLLDLRGNRLTRVIQRNAVNFLKKTVVLMWNNPYEDDLQDHFVRPRHLFMAKEIFDEQSKIPNPLHLFTQREQFAYDF